MDRAAKPAFHAMTLDELSAWVTANNVLEFDSVCVDELTDDEADAAREELESNADELFHALAQGGAA